MKTVQNPVNSTPMSMPASLPKPDSSGTDPNRYATPANMEKNKDDYNKKPDNHTKSHERMLNPERGNK